MNNGLTFISYTLATVAGLLFVAGLAVLSGGGEVNGAHRESTDYNRLFS